MKPRAFSRAVHYLAFRPRQATALAVLALIGAFATIAGSLFALWTVIRWAFRIAA